MSFRPSSLARIVVAGLCVLLPAIAIAAQAQPAKSSATNQSGTCYTCHEPIKAFHATGKHKDVACASCHDGTAEHLKDASSRPVTKTDPAVCGGCHRNQFETFFRMNWDKTARAEKSRASVGIAEPRVGQADDAARLHARAQRAALARLRAVRPARGRSLLRRALRAEDRVAIPRHRRRQHRPVERARGQVPRPGPQGAEAGDSGGGQPRLPLLQDAGSHPRVGVHGRSGAEREMEPHLEGRRHGEERQPLAQLLLLPRSALDAAADRARCADPGAHASGEGHAVAQRSARRQDRRQGDGAARLHAQDRDPRPLRHQPAVRPVPRRVQLQSRHRSEDRASPSP